MTSLKLILESAQEVIDLLGHYPYWPSDEREVDKILYAYLSGRFGNASRQWSVNLSGGTRGRIDFRTGGPNPLVAELAVRTSQGGNLSVGANRSELSKLSRVPSTEARVRVLLLLDLTVTPLNYTRLKQGYADHWLGRGRFVRQPVSVVYACRSQPPQRFIWSPFR